MNDLLFAEAAAATRQALGRFPCLPAQVSVYRIPQRAAIQIRAEFGQRDAVSAELDLRPDFDLPSTRRRHVMERLQETIRRVALGAEHINECREGIRDLVDQ